MEDYTQFCTLCVSWWLICLYKFFCSEIHFSRIENPWQRPYPFCWRYVEQSPEAIKLRCKSSGPCGLSHSQNRACIKSRGRKRDSIKLKYSDPLGSRRDFYFWYMMHLSLLSPTVEVRFLLDANPMIYTSRFRIHPQCNHDVLRVFPPSIFFCFRLFYVFNNNNFPLNLTMENVHRITRLTDEADKQAASGTRNTF